MAQRNRAGIEARAEMQKQLFALTAEAHENKQRARAFELDAERFRWLRDHAGCQIVFDHTLDQYDGGSRFELHVPLEGRPVRDAERAERLTTAIDAARAQEAK